MYNDYGQTVVLGRTSYGAPLYSPYGQGVSLREGDVSSRGVWHPAVLWQVMTLDTNAPITNGIIDARQVREVAKVALWGIPVAAVLGAVGMHFWMKRKKRR